MAEHNITADFLKEDETAIVSCWYYETGDQVSEGDTIGELMIEKVQMEIDAPASGTLTLCKEPEDEVTHGDLLAKIAE